MNNNLLQVFSSHDLFGKSVPSAVLLLGALSFLPMDLLSLGVLDDGLSLLNIAALVLILLLVGLTLGQGIHTIADNFEKMFLWLAKLLRRLFNTVRVWSINRCDHDPSLDTVKAEDGGIRNLIVEWIRRRY
ncbi:hypothetical protein C440_05350 [Haloferax mucosum ATCC BAA-1512]|uniref:Uncharacterized protein n=1 Tax=Haloferax mucosum ATCC BAA-1512 TaxID=662479 RepID=M0IKW3_9EURY|nr:hypothetical protein C440_05350 [Haloferax mucosum ATCC BAA-1512]